MFARVVLLHFEKVLLSVGTDLNDVLGLDMLLNLLPVAPVRFERIEEGLMLGGGPILAVLGDDVGLARLLGGQPVGRVRAGQRGRRGRRRLWRMQGGLQGVRWQAVWEG